MPSYNIQIGEGDFIALEFIKRIRKVQGTDLWELFFHGGTIVEQPIKVTTTALKRALKTSNNSLLTPFTK